MKKEVFAAVNFLVDLLRANSTVPVLTDEQLLKFRKHVCECLYHHYKDHWFPDKPMKGSGYRCIRINGKMDPLIVKAGELMGLATGALRSLFPSELTMWVDPSEVAYRIGENGSICQLYVQKPKPTAPTETPSSEELPKQHPPTPVKAAPAHHQPPTSPQLTIHQLKQQQQQQQQFSPSKSPTPPSVQFQTSSASPSRSPILNTSNAQQQLRAQHQLAMFLMNSHNTGNCKDSIRNSALESVHGMERLFVSS